MHAELEVVGEQKSYGNFFIKEYGEIFSHIFNLIVRKKIKLIQVSLVMRDCIIDYSVYSIAICVTSMWEKYKNIWSFAGDIPNSQLKVSEYIGHIRLFWDINGRSFT